MTFSEIYSSLQYDSLHNVRGSNSNSDFNDFIHLGIDKVYLSGEYPAIFFKEVKQFDDITLKEIARIHHLAWNYRRVMFLLVISPAEIRIYNCCNKPFNYENTELSLRDELQKLELISSSWTDSRNLEIIKALFSRVAVDCGLLWTTENALREKVDVHSRIDRYLVKSLLDTARELKRAKLNEEIIHSLLMRSIFIMYLEDKGAAKETKLYTEISKNAESYLDILESKSATYTLFEKVEEHFKGNVFPLVKGEKTKVSKDHLSVIQKCLIDGDISGVPKLFEWRLFRFDIIQIELLSEIYENFLEEFKETKKEEAGQYYTPPSLVDLILNEKLPTKTEVDYNVKILDPACGSGIFLVESYKRLIKRWKNANPDKQIEFKDLRELLKENIFGIEYDRLAIRVTAFSLYLAVVEQLNPKTLWIDRRYKFPHLIYDPMDSDLEYQGRNLWRADTIGLDVEELPQMDLVVGNPPFGSKIKLKTIKDFCALHGYGQDMVIPFLRKAVDFAKEGTVALIFNSKVLTNTEKPFQNFRKWLFNETYVEKLYNLSIFRKAPKSFGGQLFTSAVGPVSICFYQSKRPVVETKTIEYWAPKTYVKNSLVEGVVIDATDIKYLPREECAKPDSKIWKIGMWGTYEDFKFISKLNLIPKLGAFIANKENGLEKGLGLQFLDNSTVKPIDDDQVGKLAYIHPGAIQRFYTHESYFGKILDGVTEKSLEKYREYYKLSKNAEVKKITAFRRLNKKGFPGPHVLIKEGLSNKKICASYVEQSCSFNSKVLGISGIDKNVLKAITCFINSDVATYYLFLISASLGIEREEIKPNEIYELPFKFSQSLITCLTKHIDQIQKKVNSDFPLSADISQFEKLINIEINKLLGLSDKEQILISDFIAYSLGLIFSGNNSIALRAPSEKQNFDYAHHLCSELNDFLKGSMMVGATYFSIGANVPLNMIKLTLTEHNREIQLSSIDNYNSVLTDIDKYLIKKESKNIYIKRQIKYYDGNSIYIIKPNQIRFWSRSAAINDSNELIGEILRMQYHDLQ